MKNYVFALAAMAAAAHGAVIGFDVGTEKSAPTSSADGNHVEIRFSAPVHGTMVFRALVSYGPTDDYERTYTEKVEIRDATNIVAKTFSNVGYVKSWRIGVGTDYVDAKLNILASATRIGDRWECAGVAAAPVMGIDSGRRVTVEFDPDAGSVIEVLGSTDLKTWAPATSTAKFFKAVQKEAR